MLVRRSKLAVVDIALLGAFRATHARSGVVRFHGRKVIGLLAYIAYETPSRDRLARMLWPDLNEKAARNNLRVSLSRLNKALSEPDKPCVLVSQHAVTLNPDVNLMIDALTFTQLLEATEAHAHDSRTRCGECHKKLLEAADLYKGSFLEGFYLEGCNHFQEWHYRTREAYHLKALAVFEDLTGHYETAHDYASAEHYCRQQLKLEFFSEAAQRRLMRLLSYQGKRNEALAGFQAYQAALLQELGVEPEDETLLLQYQIQSGVLAIPEVKPAASRETQALPPHNLPVANTVFVGREQELGQLRTHLSTHRLITLLGMGGIGKTRLAIEVSKLQLEHFKDGVYLQPLALLTNATDVPAALADTLDIPLQSGANIATQVLDYLTPKHMLLVLDNAEHLLEIRTFISTLLTTAPNIHVLITSRQKLELADEAVYALNGLRYPAQQTAVAYEGSANSAVVLFMNAANRVRLDGALQANDAVHVETICQLVEGHPLALVLAASWLESLSCSEIAKELALNMDLLESPLQDIPERHQSLHATFEYSWRLLSSQEQHIFASMSVFRGGFNRQAAKEVAGASLTKISHLIHKSFIQFVVKQARYDLHELMRQFASEKLTALKQETAVHERHCEHYLTLLIALEKTYKAGNTQRALQAFDADFANISAAWRWARTHAKHDVLQDSLNSLRFFCTLGSHYQTLIDLLEPLVSNTLSASQPMFELNVNIALGTAYRQLRGYTSEDVEASFSRAFKLTEKLQESPELFSVYYGLWSYYISNHKYPESLAVIKQWQHRLELAAQAGMSGVHLDNAQVIIRHMEGAVRYQMADYASAVTLLEDALALYDPGQHTFFVAHYGQDPVAFCYTWLAWTYLMLGQTDKATQSATNAVTQAQQLNHPFTLEFALVGMTGLMLFLQDDAQSATYAQALYACTREHNFSHFIPLSTVAQAIVRFRQGDTQAHASIQSAMKAYPWTLHKDVYSAYVIAGYIEQNRLQEAEQLTTSIIERCNTSNSYSFMPELLALKADILAKQQNPHQAHAHYQQALTLSKQHNAKQLELRVALRYSKYLMTEGQHAIAKHMLENVYALFHEGFNSAPLKEAQQLLTLLSDEQRMCGS